MAAKQHLLLISGISGGRMRLCGRHVVGCHGKLSSWEMCTRAPCGSYQKNGHLSMLITSYNPKCSIIGFNQSPYFQVTSGNFRCQNNWFIKRKRGIGGFQPHLQTFTGNEGKLNPNIRRHSGKTWQDMAKGCKKAKLRLLQCDTLW